MELKGLYTDFTQASHCSTVAQKSSGARYKELSSFSEQENNAADKPSRKYNRFIIA